MGLSDAFAEAVVAVSDIDKAKEFYEGKLGLSGGTEEGDGGMTYTLGQGTKLHVYPSPDNAGKSGATLVGFVVGDVEGTVDELAGNGVSFEQYDDGPLKTNEKGIAEMGEIRSAWFKDPDGNTLAVANQ
jgi:catechol 2,3-dioxygenase-like lactoylglutathione lyase family enzyme